MVGEQGVRRGVAATEHAVDLGGRAASAEAEHGLTEAVGDLAALRMRSRIREAEALVEPTGLGGFTVAEWEIS